MKLFMEINPQLFDECSHEYTEAQNNADQVKAERQAKWDRLAELAKRNSSSRAGPAPPLTNTRGQKVHPPPRRDEDPITQDSQKRLDALRLQDENASARDTRRPRDGERQNPVSCVNAGEVGDELDADILPGQSNVYQPSDSDTRPPRLDRNGSSSAGIATPPTNSRQNSSTAVPRA